MCDSLLVIRMETSIIFPIVSEFTPVRFVFDLQVEKIRNSYQKIIYIPKKVFKRKMWILVLYNVINALLGNTN